MSYTHTTIAGAYRHTGKVAKILSTAEITKINEMGVEMESVAAGAVSDGAITDAKLATAVKVGAVTDLTTTSKTNLVGAINEVDSHADTAQAAVDAVEAILGSTPLTTTAQNVTDAVNELDTANANMVTLAGTQTLTNKTLTSPAITTPKIADGDLGLTITSADQTNAAATATIPNIGDAADEFVMKDTAQTLTLKTLTSPTVNTPVLTDPAQTVTLSAHDYEAGHADWTLSAGELLKPYHKPTNADQAVNAIVAATIRPYCFINATGQALTVKTAAGTGITIANTKAAFVMSDGTNVIRLTTDA